MSAEDFIVTLPSNACVTTYPNNQASSYTIALPKTLSLDGDFEVAVGDLQYPHNWTNFSEEYIAFVVVDPENINFAEGMITKSNNEKGLDKEKRFILTTYIRHDLILDVKFKECKGFQYYIIRIPTGNYVDVGEIAKIMVTKFTELTKDRQGVNLV